MLLVDGNSKLRPLHILKREFNQFRTAPRRGTLVFQHVSHPPRA